MTLGRVSAGSRIFVIGPRAEVLIADEVSRIAEAAFDSCAAEHGRGVARALRLHDQIYFDFAGYSNMAIGLGLALGFAFPRNFRLPYAARSVHRILAPLAHQPVAMAARLSLHSARRQSRPRDRDRTAISASCSSPAACGTARTGPS
jgi:hypothetical protein